MENKDSIFQENSTMDETEDKITNEIGKPKKLNEKSRKYYFPVSTNKDTTHLISIDINEVRELIVRESGSHRLITKAKSKHIIPPGWIHIEIEDNKQEWPNKIKETSRISGKVKEKKRIYSFPFVSKSGKNIISKVEIEDVVELLVRPSGVHRLKTKNGKLHIIPTGWISIEINSENEYWTK